ncbi:SKI family transcriptional corepressor 1 homolog-B-like [Lytechinus pictus]|uniref:SKI family transcriptional corepressor 1 homolog-B-like n=1 Tax=Lytechinus pictus TaxID=7653 RepID=UPI0030B9E2E6
MDESFTSSHLSGSSPTMLDSLRHPDSPGSPSSPQTPGSTPRPLMSPNQCHTVVLFSTPIAAIYIDGKERLCLAQISNTLLRKFSYNEIHNRRVALGVTCVQCTPVQLEMLRRAGAMPVSSRRCGMITKREAERLCKSFLCESRPPKLPDNFAFDVYHECAWGCRGDFVPSRYNSSRAKCIKCVYCGLYFSPNKFIFHTHRIADSKYRPPDAANFNSWRRHIHLIDRKPDDDLLQAWEDVKAMFNGGSRKRSNPSSSTSHSPSLQSSEAISSSPPITKRKRQSLNYQESDPVIQLRPSSSCSIDPRLDYFLSSAAIGGSNIHTPQANRPPTPSVEDNSMAAAQLYANGTTKLRQQFSAHALANRNIYAEYLSNGGKLPYPLAASFWPKTPSLISPLAAHFPRDLPPFELKGLADQRVHSLSKDSLALADIEGNSRDDEALRDLENWEKARFSLAERHFNLRDIKIPDKAEFHYGSAFRPVMANGVEMTDSAMSLRSQSGESPLRGGDPSSFIHHIVKKSSHDPSPADIFRIKESFPTRDHPASGSLPTRQTDIARYFLDDKPWGREAREGTAFLWRQQREKRLDDLLFRVARKECERKTKNGDFGEGKTNPSSVIQDAEASTSCESPDSKLENTDICVGMSETGKGNVDEMSSKNGSSLEGQATKLNRSPSPEVDVDIIQKGECPTTSIPAEDLNLRRIFGSNSPGSMENKNP